MKATNRKQKLSTNLAFPLCACGLALLFTSGCSDKTPPPAAATSPTEQAKTPVETQKLIPEEDVAFYPQTKKPDPATMEQVMVQLDYDGNLKFPEMPKGNR